MSPAGPVGPHMGPAGPVGPHMGPAGPVGPHMGPVGAVGPQGYFNQFRGLLVLYRYQAGFAVVTPRHFIKSFLENLTEHIRDPKPVRDPQAHQVLHRVYNIEVSKSH